MNHNELYIDLLLRAVLGEISDSCWYRDGELWTAFSQGEDGSSRFSHSFCRELLKEAGSEFRAHLEPLGVSADEYMDLDEKKLFSFLNWMDPKDSPHTMCGRANAETVVMCIEDILASKVAGDLMETGVWKGGMTVLMRGLLKAHSCTDRVVWVADSFEGLPKPDPKVSLKDAIFWFLMSPLQQLTIPFEEVEKLFFRYGLLDEQVRFLKGWFCDTLATPSIERLALLRLDGDLYESTATALKTLYPKLSPGGYLIVDDYGLPCGCRQAVDEYRALHGIETPMIEINEASVYWRKGG